MRTFLAFALFVGGAFGGTSPAPVCGSQPAGYVGICIPAR